jgi:hypothetical protein
LKAEELARVLSTHFASFMLGSIGAADFIAEAQAATGEDECVFVNGEDKSKLLVEVIIEEDKVIFSHEITQAQYDLLADMGALEV